MGARTPAGWTIVRGDPLAKEQTVEIRTAERPTSVRLDPLEVGPDWFGPNDVRVGLDGRGSGRVRRNVFDWPFLDPTDAERYVMRWTPIAWLSTPGAVALGLVLLECLKGEREYVGTPPEIATAKLVRPPDTSRCVPAPLVPVLAAMTHPDPAVRPTAAECARALAELPHAGVRAAPDRDATTPTASTTALSEFTTTMAG